MKKRVVVVGLGDYGTTMHIPALKNSTKAELVGVMSSDEKDVEKYSQELQVPGFTDFSACLDSLKPDFVILAVYHNQYVPLVREAAKRGIHVLKEKPLGHTLEEAKELIKIVKESRIHMQLGVNRRFAPDFQMLSEYIHNMHDKHFFEVNYSIGYYQYPHVGWRGERSISGGGSIIDFGYHAIDVILWNFGLPKGILAEMSWKAKPNEAYDTEDTATFLLRYKPEEFYGNVILSRVLPKKEYYRIVGSEEIVEYENGVIRLSSIDGKVIIKEESLKAPKQEVTTREIDYFCDVIDGKEKPVATPTEHLEHMALVTAAYDSEKQGKYINPQEYL